MTHLLTLVLAVGLVDSLNPATIAPALYLAAGKNAIRGLIGFIVGAYTLNLVAGILLAVGPGQAILAVIPKPGDEARHLLELITGVALLVVAAGLWIGRERVAHHVTANEGRFDRSSLLVGAGIMLFELPTAVPYFAVIAAVVGSGKAIPSQITLLAIFNAALFLPVFLILGIRALANERGLRLLERVRATLDEKLATIIPVLVLVVALILLALGAVGVVRDR